MQSPIIGNPLPLPLRRQPTVVPAGASGVSIGRFQSGPTNARISGYAVRADRFGVALRSFTERVDMYAVIKTGGKQYKVATGEKLKIEQIAAEVGQQIVIDRVLAVGTGAELQVGTPWVAGASVTATVLAQGRHDKVRIFKMRRRKHYQKRQGHRQNFTEIEIGAVSAA